VFSGTPDEERSSGRSQNHLVPGQASSAEQQKVQRLLAVARAHLMVGRLIQPQGSNAYDAYQLVLEIDPSNADAKQGVEVVSNRLVEQSLLLWQEGQVDAARNQLKMGLQLFPHHSGLLALQRQMNAQRSAP